MKWVSRGGVDIVLGKRRRRRNVRIQATPTRGPGDSFHNNKAIPWFLCGGKSLGLCVCVQLLRCRHVNASLAVPIRSALITSHWMTTAMAWNRATHASITSVTNLNLDLLLTMSRVAISLSRWALVGEVGSHYVESLIVLFVIFLMFLKMNSVALINQSCADNKRPQVWVQESSHKKTHVWCPFRNNYAKKWPKHEKKCYQVNAKQICSEYVAAVV